MTRETKGLANFPPIRWAMIHPRLAAWIVLSTGMVTLLIIEARDIGATPAQWAALIGACVLVAGLCVLIIASEDDDQDETPAEGETPEKPGQ
jgi:hypothetical protein